MSREQGRPADPAPSAPAHAQIIVEFAAFSGFDKIGLYTSQQGGFSWNANKSRISSTVHAHIPAAAEAFVASA
jgi:hypothetical protein